MMSKKLIADIYGGYRAMNDYPLIPVNSKFRRTTSLRSRSRSNSRCSAQRDIVMGLQRNDLKDLLDTIVEIDS